ncbi:metalloregulator ArsR/SmtB family transcription factor [Cutibacterium acnes]
MLTETQVLQALMALAQPVRLRLFRALVVAGPEGVTPGTLAQALEVSPSALSFHRKELLHAGLVTQERRGRHLIYRAAFDTMRDVLAYLTENCCAGGVCPAVPVSALCGD